jgi:hypothetical protein
MPTKASNTNPTLVVALDEETIHALAAALGEVLRGSSSPTPEPEGDQDEDGDAEDEGYEAEGAEDEDAEDDDQRDEEPEEDESENEEEGDEEEDNEEDEGDDEEEEADDDYWTVDSLIALGHRGLRRMARENGVGYYRETEDADIAEAIIDAMNEQDEEEE